MSMPPVALHAGAAPASGMLVPPAPLKLSLPLVPKKVSL
jgi:hypothetical protein